MKNIFVFIIFLLTLCLPLSAQVFYEGQGGRNLGGVRVSEITGTGLSNDEIELLPLIQMTLSNDFVKYAGITVPAPEDKSFSTRYTLTGTIRKTSGLYYLAFTIKDNSTGITKTTYGPMQCTLEELRTLKGIKAASEELIRGLGITLTRLGENALRTTATSEAEAMNILAKSLAAGATEFERMLYVYQANQLDPTLAEAARRVAAYQTEIYRAPEINLAMPEIRIPEIKAPEFKAPEIKMAATGNIGADARQRQEQYNAQREASRVRQESGNKAMKDLQDAFLVQFREQSEAVKKQQADLLKQRDILLEQQRTLLARQRQMIAQLQETENSYDTFFTRNPPFEIIYDPVVRQVGADNLEKGTIDLQFRIATIGTQAMQVIPIMLADFEKGLSAIELGFRDINNELDKVQNLLEKVEAAGRETFNKLVNDYAEQMKIVQASEDEYMTQLARLDTALNTTGYAQLGRDYAVRPDTVYAERLALQYAVRPSGYNAVRDHNNGLTWSLSKWNRDETRTFAIEALLENDAGRIIGRGNVTLTNRVLAESYTQPLSDSAYCVFRDVPVRDITDRLKVTIQRVNNRDVTVAANASYIKISPIEPDGYTKDGLDIEGYDKEGFYVYGFDKEGYNRNGINKNGRTRAQEAKIIKDAIAAEEKAQREAEKKEKKAARKEERDKIWDRAFVSYFISGVFDVQHLVGLFEPGFEVGFKWVSLDGGVGLGNGRFIVDDRVVEEKFGPIEWGPRKMILSPRFGAAVPVYIGKSRLNLGGGFEFRILRIRSPYQSGDNINNYRTLEFLRIPYIGARLQFPFNNNGSVLGFFGYRYGFMPDIAQIYLEKPSSSSNTLFIGLQVSPVLTNTER